ncbi:glucan endo-1,3-beta-glucosidase [Musa troglodytarum]|uniref:Glucan endo-1,3-beta-glucosidase n=1 Tax=Musa troglodytarum TaxID=320322 RepID=A0A9E7EQ30_9LILI|nr:glucan endo-1,3-beta-glucosidase [Musa troglodytarum]
MASLAKPVKLLVLPLLLLHLLSFSAALSVGVNYGAFADNLPPPGQVAAFLKDRTFVDRVKLFDANPDIIRAFAGTGISLMITVPNGDIPSLASGRSSAPSPAASAWVATNVAPSTLRPTSPSSPSETRVSTPNSLGILSASEPPSTGRFRPGYDRVIFAPMLDFHRRTSTPFVVNPYPYFGYTARTLDYALFRPNPGVFDAATGVNYTNMFEAQLDAVHAAMQRLGYGDVEIAVGETGWPSAGDPGQLGVSVEDAVSYNANLIRLVNSGKGTPMMPGRRFETYVFALFNENLKPGPTAERHFGLFNPDLSPSYDVGLMRDSNYAPAPSSDSWRWCVATADASAAELQNNIDYACGSGGADCRAIQNGGACFDPDTLSAHASYAMNAYYQGAGRYDFNCYFGGTGVLTSTDPSYGNCRYQS